MKYTELTVGVKTYKTQREIYKILIKEGFSWLVDSTIENAVLEIRNNTLIWHGGDFYEGNWRYGIFKDGRFCGNWEGGIFEAGTFEGKWLGGIRL
jgi:hypothetical protein